MLFAGFLGKIVGQIYKVHPLIPACLQVAHMQHMNRSCKSVSEISAWLSISLCIEEIYFTRVAYYYMKYVEMLCATHTSIVVFTILALPNRFCHLC